MSEKICTLVEYENLPPEEQADCSSNGSGAEYSGYLKVKFPGSDAVYYSDAMEPEDACFHRDLSWVSGVIEQAYEEGLKHEATP